MPYVICASSMLFLAVGVIVALGAGSVSQETNGGYVYTVTLLYLTLPLRFAIALFALVKLMIDCILPVTMTVEKKTREKATRAGGGLSNKSGASEMDTMAVVGATTRSTSASSATTKGAIVMMATAKWDFKGGHSTELSFAKGDRIVVTNTDQAEPGWYSGYVLGKDRHTVGLFPFNRVVEDAAESAPPPPVPTNSQAKKKKAGGGGKKKKGGGGGGKKNTPRKKKTPTATV